MWILVAGAACSTAPPEDEAPPTQASTSESASSPGGTGDTEPSPVPPAPADDTRDYTGTLDGSDSTLGDQMGLPNPDTEHITGSTGDPTISVEPRDDPGDYANLQWAVDNVAEEGTVRLGPGAFFLGDGNTEAKHTVHIRRAVQLVGTRAGGDGGDWGTAIQGGGALDTFSAMGGRLEGGPFRVVAGDQGPVAFEDLWFRHWTGSAIYVESSSGVELSDSYLSDPVSPAGGSIRFVHAVFSSGEDARGAFRASGNLVDLSHITDTDGTGVDEVDEVRPVPLPHDEQFLGIFFSNHDRVEIEGNSVTGVDEGLEIIGNGRSPSGEPYPGGGGEVTVRGNTVDVTQVVDDTWPGRFALLVANNAGPVSVEGNAVTTRGLGWGLGLSGTGLTVADNTFTFETHEDVAPPGAVMIGFPAVGGFEMGPSLVNSTLTDNTFAGSVTSTGIVFFGNANTSHANVLDVGDSLASLGAEVTIRLAAGVYDTTVRGDLGTVIDDAPLGANLLEPTSGGGDG